MGTRSLLGVETKKDNIHVQYMQFDGYPSVKGYEYYRGILTALMQLNSASYSTKKGTPNSFFKQRCLDFLNEYQYASGHSIGNNFEVKVSEWEDQNCCQEWQYLFDLKGDYSFFNHYSNAYNCSIPWGVTKGIADSFDLTNINCNTDERKDILYKFFDECDCGETLPVLLVEIGSIIAFPEQYDDGWREYGIITLEVDGKVVDTLESVFATRLNERKDIKEFRVQGVRK